VVLPAFGIEPSAIELRHHALNSVFLVTDVRGNRYSVRVMCGDHTLLAVQSQAVWMDSLCRHGVPGIPRVIPSVADGLAVGLRLPGHREDRCCMVHEWVPGSQLAGQTSAEHFNPRTRRCLSPAARFRPARD
jgi:Ser/Thr protein kinase RdoA (MazF antagonist)